MILGREPAAIVAVVQAALYALGLFVVDLTDPLQLGIVAVIAAALDLIVVWKTTDKALGVALTLLKAVLALAVMLGAPLTEMQIAGLLAFAGAALSLFQRTQTSPIVGAHTAG